MTVEVKFTNVRLSTLLLKLRGRGWPAAGGGVAHVGVEVWWITVVETHTLCLYIHTRSLPSWLKNTVVLSKIQDIHVWCVGSTTVSGEMSMWQLSPGSSCRVCLSSSSYSNFMKATCPCWSLKQIQFHPYICNTYIHIMYIARTLFCLISMVPILGEPPYTKSAVFLNIVQKGGGIKPMFKNFGANFVWF